MRRKLSREEKKVTELVRRRMRESKATELLGFDVESVHEGRAIFRLDVRPKHKQIHGVVHGGILAALADTTAAIAAYTVIPRGMELATLELKINYLEPVPGGKVRADAKVLRSGRKFIVTECGIFNETGSLAAKAILTFSAAFRVRFKEVGLLLVAALSGLFAILINIPDKAFEEHEIGRAFAGELDAIAVVPFDVTAERFTQSRTTTMGVRLCICFTQ